MHPATSPLRSALGFTKAEDVAPDEERPDVLRARTLPFGIDPRTAFDFRSCTLHDCNDPHTPDARLEQAGFETIDLSGNAPLQAALATIRDEDRLSDAAADAVRAAVNGARLELADGKVLRVEHVAEEGMIHRRVGPNGLDVNPGGMDGANGHGGAQTIHADQDVFGTPLKQMMNGGAPNLFRHQTPDARNDESSLFLLNLWIPLQQITRPLVLMDRRTLDAKSHQLRYGLPVTRFLDREEESRVNDIWTFLPDPAQAFYFRSSMRRGQAYVFDTLGEPHGACILPGEETLERLYLDLGRGLDAIEARDERALGAIAAEPAPPLPEITTEPIREAAARMQALLDEATTRPDALCASPADWTSRARAARDAVIRKSIEMRMVATLTAE